jgi:phytoene/squalene synthetase
MSAERDDIEQAVAGGDPDRMAAAFFAPRSVRPDLMALYAFNLEMSRVRDVVREPLAGQMRFAWWRDQMNRSVDGKALETPVGRSLAGAISRHALPLELIHGLIDARSSELSEAPFASEAEFDAHAAATSSAIMKLAARICGAGGRADAVAGPAGLAFALVGTLRAMPHEAAHRRCFVPLSALAKAGIGPEDVFAGDIVRIRPVVHAMAARAMDAIRSARRFAIPTGASAAILPAVLARQHIPLLLSPGVDPFAAPPQLARLTAAASLARAAWTGRV